MSIQGFTPTIVTGMRFIAVKLTQDFGAATNSAILKNFLTTNIET